MKLATFKTEQHLAPTYGVVVDDSLIDLPAASQLRNTRSDAANGTALPGSLRDYLIQFSGDLRPLRELLDWARQQAPATPPLRYSLSEVTILPPIPDPDKFICVGKNNREHLEELKRNDLLKEWPSEPTGFIKLNSALLGHDGKVRRPAGIVQFDYEPEMVFVISRRAYRVSRTDAIDYVFGITLLNDLTAREVQKREVASGTRFWTAKNMPGFGPVGPFVITLDEIDDAQNLWITCSVNGELRMRVNTSEQIFQIPDIIEHYSRYMPLEAGDLFSTGSAGGVAMGKPNASELFLKPGDVVEVGFEGLATLRTFISE